MVDSFVGALRILLQVLANDCLQWFQLVALHVEGLLDDVVRETAFQVELKHQRGFRLPLANRFK